MFFTLFLFHNSDFFFKFYALFYEQCAISERAILEHPNHADRNNAQRFKFQINSLSFYSVIR